jgi:hypothetical protein
LLWSALDSFFARRSLVFLHFQRCLLFLDSKRARISPVKWASCSRSL